MNSVTSNAVAKQLKITYSDVTLADQSMSKTCVLQKQGRLVTMSLRIWKEATVAISAGTILAILPAGYRPNSIVYFNVTNFDVNKSNIALVADNYGSIYNLPVINSERLDLYMTGSWFTA